VIAANDEDADAGLMEPADLRGKESRGLHGGLVAVIEVAGEDQRIDLIGKAQVNDALEGSARGIPDQLSEAGVAQRK
jgi:hypothetical protein